jgi:hypothetical protein
VLGQLPEGRQLAIGGDVAPHGVDHAVFLRRGISRPIGGKPRWSSVAEPNAFGRAAIA